MFLFFMDIGYINARVRAWKGEFFDEEDYKDLLSIASIDEFIVSLKGTSYGFDLEEAKARFSGMPVTAVFDNGLKGNLSRTFKSIWNESPSKIRELIRLLFFIWDVHNLKTIIRGIHKGVNPDEIYSILIPAGDFDESALKELARQNNIDGLIHILNTWDNPYGKPLGDGLSDYLENKEIVINRMIKKDGASVYRINGKKHTRSEDSCTGACSFINNSSRSNRLSHFFWSI